MSSSARCAISVSGGDGRVCPITVRSIGSEDMPMGWSAANDFSDFPSVRVVSQLSCVD